MKMQSSGLTGKISKGKITVYLFCSHSSFNSCDWSPLETGHHAMRTVCTGGVGLGQPSLSHTHEPFAVLLAD